MTRDYDIIIYGASGFASKYIIKKLLGHNIDIALAGRNKKKIEENIHDIPNASELDIFEANVDKQSEIDLVTSKATILLNCAGPYIYSGELVVSSCLRTRTHYLDISGETYFIERCISKYAKEAEEKGIYIINCAGFDSVPADIGVEYLKDILIKENNDKKDNDSCEDKIENNEAKKIKIESTLILKDCFINKTTYDSAVHGFGKKQETIKLRKMHHSKSNARKTKIKKLFYNEELKKYCGIFPGTDASVVKRTQQEFAKRTISIPCEYLAYVQIGSLFKTIMVVGTGVLFYLMSLSRLGRWCLLNFPRTFTLNCIKNRRPTENEIKRGSFEFKFLGTLGDIKKKMIISGPDPGYLTTAICLTECAILLLEMVKNKEENPELNTCIFKGGVLTPGVVFNGSDIVDRLKVNGIGFELVE